MGIWGETPILVFVTIRRPSPTAPLLYTLDYRAYFTETATGRLCEIVVYRQSGNDFKSYCIEAETRLLPEYKKHYVTSEEHQEFLDLFTWMPAECYKKYAESTSFKN